MRFGAGIVSIDFGCTFDNLNSGRLIAGRICLEGGETGQGVRGRKAFVLTGPGRLPIT